MHHASCTCAAPFCPSCHACCPSRCAFLGNPGRSLAIA
jgi:hypothetical protein